MVTLTVLEAAAPVQTDFLPLTAGDRAETFRVDGPMAVRSLVRELIAAHSQVALFAGNDVDRFIITHIQSLEADTITFDFTGPEPGRDALRRSAFATAVGITGSVKIQFPVADIEISEAGDAPPSLTAPVPGFGWRVQRRNAFRVQPPAADVAAVMVRLGTGSSEVATRMEDLSAGGLALRWPGGVPCPDVGATLRHCRIEAVNVPPIPCELQVIRVQQSDPQAPALLSCEFYAMPPEVARLVQVYVMDIERRERKAQKR